MGKIVVFGEILWDLLPGGKKLGGAPSNFAYHLQVFGAKAVLFTSVGNDSLGNEAREILVNHGIDESFILIDSVHPTGSVLVELDSEGHASYTFASDVAWDYLDASESLLDEAKSADALYFGTLALRCQGNLKTLKTLLERIPPKAMRIFDLNLRFPFYSPEIILELLHEATFFKLNDDELVILAEMFDLPGKGIEREMESEKKELYFRWAESLIERFNLDFVALTCGSIGSYLYQRENAESNRLISNFIAAPQVEVVDTIGAGDAFTAVAVLGLLQKLPLSTIHQKANEYAAFICTQAGAMPRIKEI